MTTPVYLVSPADLDGVTAGGELLLDGAEGRHAATVRRTRAGESVDVADGAGRIARCAVVDAARDRLRLRVDRIDHIAPRLPRLVLVQALAKGGRDESAIETATELGVDAVVPWQASRSVAVWAGPERSDRGRRRWEATVRAAAKQARRATVPTVEPLVDTPALAARAASSSLVLVLHEQASEPLVSLPAAALDGAEEALLVVGPEGGITDAELAALTAAGACPVRLGPEVLRTSSAGPAALAVLAARLGRWS